MSDGERYLAVTLHRVEEQKTERSAPYSCVEVRLDGDRVGVLTKAMSEKIADVVQYVTERGKTPVCRAVLKGSPLRAWRSSCAACNAFPTSLGITKLSPTTPPFGSPTSSSEVSVFVVSSSLGVAVAVAVCVTTTVSVAFGVSALPAQPATHATPATAKVIRRAARRVRGRLDRSISFPFKVAWMSVSWQSRVTGTGER